MYEVFDYKGYKITKARDCVYIYKSGKFVQSEDNAQDAMKEIDKMINENGGY